MEKKKKTQINGKKLLYIFRKFRYTNTREMRKNGYSNGDFASGDVYALPGR